MSTAGTYQQQPQQVPLSGRNKGAAGCRPDDLRPILSPWVAGLGLLALHVSPLSPEYASAHAALGVPLDRWYASLKLLLSLYTGWHVAFAVLGFLQRGSAMTATTMDDDLMAVLNSRTSDARGGHRAFIYTGMLWLAARPLELASLGSSSGEGGEGWQVQQVIDKGFKALCGLWLLELAWDLLAVLLTHMMMDDDDQDDQDEGGNSRKSSSSSSRAPAVHTVLSFARPLFFLGGVLAIADNAGIQVGPLVASLSLGGIAVAFSTKMVLEDLAAGLSLLVERPFRVGDSISLGGGVSGTVVSVGIKSTVLKCVGGEVVVVGNKDVANSKITKHQDRADRLATVVVTLAPESVPSAGQVVGGAHLVQDIQAALAAAAQRDDDDEEGESRTTTRSSSRGVRRAEVVVESVLLCDVLPWGGGQVEVRYRALGSSYGQARRARHDVIVATVAALHDKGLKLATPGPDGPPT